MITSKEAKALFSAGIKNEDEVRKARTYKVLRALNAPEEYAYRSEEETEAVKPRSLEVRPEECLHDFFNREEEKKEEKKTD